MAFVKVCPLNVASPSPWNMTYLTDTSLINVPLLWHFLISLLIQVDNHVYIAYCLWQNFNSNVKYKVDIWNQKENDSSFLSTTSLKWLFILKMPILTQYTMIAPLDSLPLKKMGLEKNWVLYDGFHDNVASHTLVDFCPTAGRTRQ